MDPEVGPPDLRGQYESAYVQWMDESASSECLEDRMAAALALADTASRLHAQGLSKEAMRVIRSEYADFL
jgi:hypothetical protein